MILACPPPLRPLMNLLPELDALCELGRDVPICDCYIPLLSLPGVLRTTVETVPADVPYLAADAGLIAHWRSALGPAGPFRIGIAWQGSPTYNHDRWRSIQLAEFAPLAGVPGVELVSLQKGFGAEQAAGVGFPLLDLSGQIDEAAGPLMDTAAIMRNLDLVVTSDTSLAPPGWWAGRAGLGRPALRGRLAVADRAGRQPLVSQHAAVSPGQTG